MLAPIIVFAYNRPSHLYLTLRALSNNDLADQSDLFIYCDGPKADALIQQITAINKVRSIAHSEKWCKNVTVIESEHNKGLADSIIEGVTEIVEQFGRVIVLEDDIVTSKGFLRYMNDALDMYESYDQVMHISGYMYPHKERLKETFLCPLPLCWGWGTWSRSWRLFDGDAQKWANYYEANRLWSAFNVFGGTILQDQLKDNVNGKIKTWFIKWHSSVLFYNGLALFPAHSLVNNIGMDNSGEHCSISDKFSVNTVADSIRVKRIPIKESRKGKKAIMHFYQGYWYSKRNRRKIINKIKGIFTK